MAIEGKPAAGPVEEILQDLGLAHSGGAKPEAAEGGSGAAPTEAAAPKPSESAAETAPATRPLTTLEIVAPGSTWIGEVNKGATPYVRTVTASQFQQIEKALLEGAKIVSKPSYTAGTWYRRNDSSEFGIRNSDQNGLTIDIKDPALPSVVWHAPERMDDLCPQ
jgi:hypothetical protein